MGLGFSIGIGMWLVHCGKGPLVKILCELNKGVSICLGIFGMVLR